MHHLKLVLAALPFFSMAKCVDIEHSTQLFPDGSGRFVLSLTVEKNRGSQGPEESLVGLVDMCEGYAALTLPVTKMEGGLKTLTWKLYFDDISKFRFVDTQGPRDVQASFDLSTTGKEHSLLFRNNLIRNWLRDAKEPLKPDDKEPESNDFYAFTITVPGKIVRVEGLPPAKGRTVGMRVDEKTKYALRRGDAGAKRAVADLAAEAKITWTGSEVTAEELDAFKKELAAAKEAWKTLEPKVRKIAEESKKR